MSDRCWPAFRGGSIPELAKAAQRRADPNDARGDDWFSDACCHFKAIPACRGYTVIVRVADSSSIAVGCRRRICGRFSAGACAASASRRSTCEVDGQCLPGLAPVLRRHVRARSARDPRSLTQLPRRRLRLSPEATAGLLSRCVFPEIRVAAVGGAGGHSRDQAPNVSSGFTTENFSFSGLPSSGGSSTGSGLISVSGRRSSRSRIRVSRPRF